MAGLFPFYVLREWDNSGRILSGGRLYFYESGTLVPKATYTDHTLTIPNTNPVVLDSGGAADIWLGEGAYRVLLTDANGVQIRSPIDGVQGVSSGSIDPASNAKLAILQTYDDLRALTTIPDVVYVCGRSTEGDGGQGLFQYIPVSVDTDDDGVILVTTTGVHVYRRVFDAALDPRWYGVKYGTGINQSTELLAAYNGSVRHNVPAVSAGPIYLSTNFVAPVGTLAKFGVDSYLHAGSTISVEFPTGTQISGDGVIFGVNITPVIGASTCDALRLRWFGGADDDEAVAKLISASTSPYNILIDVSRSVVTGIAFRADQAVDFVGGAVLSQNGGSVSIPNLVYRGFAQILSYPDKASVGPIDLGDTVYLEWFGGVANNDTADNTLALHCCVKAGRWDAVQARYHIDSTYTAATPLTIVGTGATQIDVKAGVTVTLAGGSITGVIDTGTGTLTSSAALEARDSVLYHPGNLRSCWDSELHGPVVVSVNNTELIGCKLVSTGPMITDTGTSYHIILRACDLRGVESLLYTLDTGVVLDVFDCRVDEIAYSNGFATVNVVGDKIGNPTATTINGIKCLGDDVGVILAPEIITTPPVNMVSHIWFGFVGGQVLDGESIITQADMTLANPATVGATNTLRYRRGPVGLSNEYGLLALAYFGGYIDLEVVYPIGVTPDPAARLIAKLVRPKLMYSSTTHSQTDVPLCAHNVYGNVVGYSATKPGTYRTRTCVWGGLTQVGKPTLVSGITIRDEWNDTVINYGDFFTTFYESMRIVIGSSTGAGVVPAGTRIKVTLVPSLPRRQAFDTFFSEAPKAASPDDGGFEPQAMAYRDVIGTDKPHLFADRISMPGKLLYLNAQWRNGFSYSFSGGPSISMPAYQYWAAGFPSELDNSWLTLEMRVAGIQPHAEDQTKLFAFHRFAGTSYQSQYYCP